MTSLETLQFIINIILFLLFLYNKGQKIGFQKLLHILIDAIEETDNKGQKRSIQIRTQGQVGMMLDEVLEQKKYKKK